MSQGSRAVDGMLAQIEGLRELAHNSAPAVAVAVAQVFQRQIKAGTDPDGKPWQKTQEGEQPLQNAAKALTVVAVGETVFARLKGPEARHHKGRARGGVVRQIFPTKGLNRKLADAIRAAVVKQFELVVRPSE